MMIASLFEDEDDLHLFGQLARALGLPDLEQPPTSLKGYDPPKLRRRLATITKTDWERIVLVLDADRAPEGGPKLRWKEVLDALRTAKIDIPGDAAGPPPGACGQRESAGGERRAPRNLCRMAAACAELRAADQ